MCFVLLSFVSDVNQSIFTVEIAWFAAMDSVCVFVKLICYGVLGISYYYTAEKNHKFLPNILYLSVIDLLFENRKTKCLSIYLHWLYYYEYIIIFAYINHIKFNIMLSFSL